MSVAASTSRAFEDETAVERFSSLHDELRRAATARYRALLPAEPPRAGQQYAFDVDLDACTGCKACVTACHNMNGLDPGETWRTVGLLVGGSMNEPLQQHVTTSCHHCEDPGCLQGCPVLAYEKDPLTGIVRHLDDQCIGCQYCVLKCPYDAPKFNASLGIVRKCDLCTDRLKADEAPACVQGCPNGAIAIRVIDVDAARAADPLLPLDAERMPDSAYTRPTTRYRSRRADRFERPGSFGTPRPAHAHTPLTVMLTLTQLAVGGILWSLWGARGDAALDARQLFASTAATGLGLLGLGASVLHLGRPLQAWRAFLGWRTSWMSREVLVLGGFAQASVGYVAAQWLGLPDALVRALGLAALASGLAGVACSTMIYVDTRRPFWKLSRTSVRFALTTFLLGAATWSTSACALGAHDGLRIALAAWALAGATKLGWELACLRADAARPHSALGRSARLLQADLNPAFRARSGAGALGGILVPVVLLTMPLANAATFPVALLGFALVLLAEGTERWLFFTAEATAGMPEV
jgi:formate dehydrogenase iron-sulfur subunit